MQVIDFEHTMGVPISKNEWRLASAAGISVINGEGPSPFMTETPAALAKWRIELNVQSSKIGKPLKFLTTQLVGLLLISPSLF